MLEKIQTRTISFPTDEELKQAIQTKGLYKRVIEKFVLSEYEAYAQETSYSKLSHLPQITTDHVMPQNWHGDWQSNVSREEHNEVKDLWGNLVPLSHSANSAKSARNFEETKAILKREVSFVTTVRLLDEHKNWNKETLMQRTSKLADWAILRWPKKI